MICPVSTSLIQTSGRGKWKASDDASKYFCRRGFMILNRVTVGLLSTESELQSSSESRIESASQAETVRYTSTFSSCLRKYACCYHGSNGGRESSLLVAMGEGVFRPISLNSML